MDRYERDVRDIHLGEGSDGGSGVLSIFQMAGALFGLLIILLGVILSIFLLFRVFDVLSNPKEYEPVLNQWSEVVRGFSDDLRKNEDFRADMERFGLDHPDAVPRVIAILVNLFLVMIVFRFCVLLIQAGGHLVALANPWRHLYRKILNDLAQGNKSRMPHTK